MGKSNILGSWGETLAADYLRKKRFKMVAMNYRSRYGEIDLIVSNKKHLVFVEVKLRKNSDFAAAREFVTFSKQRRIISTASLWLSIKNCELQPRFDVIEIYAPDGINSRRLQINHLVDAFQ